MRTLRTATPVPLALHYDDAVCPEILPSRRLSLVSQTHLPTLREGSLDCNAQLSRIVPHAFSPSEFGRTEIVALVASPSHPRKRRLFKSALERRRSQGDDHLPDVNSRDIAKENIEPESVSASSASCEWAQRVRRPQHHELTRRVSYPVISTRIPILPAKSSGCSSSKSLPRLDSIENLRTITENKHAAKLRRHIQQENLGYDSFSTKAVILERFLNSQS